MIVSSPIPLDTFERTIQSDPEVLGVLYFGSLGRGTAGRFSDLDVFVWLPDDLAIPARDKLLQLLSLFGENHWLETGDRHVTGFVGSEWTQVDIEFAQREHVVPSARYAGATVIKDADGVLATMAAACEPERLTETVESAADVIHGAISVYCSLPATMPVGQSGQLEAISPTRVRSFMNCLDDFVGGVRMATAMSKSYLHPMSRHY
jgi:hypothetical protein